MAEVSSTLESGTSNTSSDDMIIKSIQESIDAEVGLVPRDMKDKQQLHELNVSSSFDQIDDLHVEQGQELVQKGDTPATKFNNSSHIEVINEGKEEQIVGLGGNSKRNEVKEGKKEKRPRKRGKGSKQPLIPDFERQTVCDCDKRGDRARVVYITEEMEALRHVAMDEQKKKWIEAYCGLGPDAAMEYDTLTGSTHSNQDENYVNFDPRLQFANKKGNNEAQNTNQVDHGVNVGDLDEQEDYYEEEDSDSDHVSIQRPAFMVTGEPDFDSGPPQDGLEYLRRVRWETEHIPKVKVAKVEKSVLNKEQTVYMPNIPDIAACPENLMPSKEWEDAFLVDFSKLRLALSQHESSEEIESIPLAQNLIDTVIQENLDFSHTDDAIQENLDIPQTEDKTVISDWPSLQNILETEPVTRVIMLRKRITSMESMSSLCRNDCEWLFALCAAIDTPLDADTSASVRCLLRKCAALRAEKLDLDDEVIMLNILVTISGKYFGQLESN